MDEPSKKATAGEEEEHSKSKSNFWQRKPVIFIGFVILAIISFFGIGYLLENLTHESTDDAFLDGSIISVAPKVPGQVEKVFVVNNQVVKAGDPLVQLDARDLAVELEQKKAAAQSAQANVALLRSSLDLLRAQIETAEATARETESEASASKASADKAAADLKRAEELMQQKTLSPQEFDNAKTAAAWAIANLAAAREKANSDRSRITQAKAQFDAGRKAYERAEAQNHQAEVDVQSADLNLSYVRIVAPEDGQVTRKAVENGDYLLVGQKIMALVTRHLWVTANFKETQLIRIRTNLPVSITVDSLGGHSFKGHVESIQSGSGARFSLLPPENAVGNYVKVVQRIPVRIHFDDPIPNDHVLGPGMSVVPSVAVSSFEMPKWVVLLASIFLALLVTFLWWRLANRAATQK